MLHEVYGQLWPAISCISIWNADLSVWKIFSIFCNFGGNFTLFFTNPMRADPDHCFSALLPGAVSFSLSPLWTFTMDVGTLLLMPICCRIFLDR